MNTCWADHKLTELKRGSADYWILYATAGDAEFWLGNAVSYIAAGQAMIITMTNQDVQIIPGQKFQCCMFRVCDPAFCELARRYLSLMNAPTEMMHVIQAFKQEQNIINVFEKIQNIDVDDGQKYSLLEELMIRLYRASPKTLPGAYTSRLEIVDNIRARLEKEYSEDFSLAGIAADYDMSVSYLAHLFKETTGISIMRYLLNCRVSAAKKHLVETTLSIRDIAEQCGFNDVSNFARTFRKETGCSPRQYRRDNYIYTSSNSSVR